MKKILVFTTLLIGFLARAQSTADIIMARVQKKEAEEAAIKKEKDDKAAIFNHPNKDYIISLQKLDESGGKLFADKVASFGKTKWEFIKIIENEKKGFYRVKYIDSSTPIDLKEKIINGTEECDLCLNVDFLVYFEGENKDLEIKGIKKYRFREVSGKYLDLFPVWKNIFRPDVSIETTLNDYSSQELVQKVIGIRYKLVKQGEKWTLANYSNLFDYFQI
jgi:hypothetical protein